jgi:hypothetical protein
MEGGGRDEAGQGVLLALPVGLPPVRVLLVDHVENVALVEGDAQLATRHVLVVFRLVVYLRLIKTDKKMRILKQFTGKYWEIKIFSPSPIRKGKYWMVLLTGEKK